MGRAGGGVGGGISLLPAAAASRRLLPRRPRPRLALSLGLGLTSISAATATPSVLPVGADGVQQPGPIAYAGGCESDEPEESRSDLSADLGRAGPLRRRGAEHHEL